MNDFNIACFLSAARVCSFSAAAKEFSISQQMISRNIKQLETELGFLLFARSGGQLSLTRGGREFFDWLIALDGAIAWGREAFSGDDFARLCIMYSQLISPPEALLEAVEQLRAAFPEAEPELCAGPENGEAEALEKRAAKLAVIPEPMALEYSGRPNICISAPFAWAPLYLFAPEDCVAPQGPRWDALARLPRLAPAMGDVAAAFFDKCAAGPLRGAGYFPAGTELCVNLQSAYTRCLCGDGYVVSPENGLTRYAEGIAAIPLDETLPLVAVSLCAPTPPLVPELLALLGREGDRL